MKEKVYNLYLLGEAKDLAFLNIKYVLTKDALNADIIFLGDGGSINPLYWMQSTSKYYKPDVDSLRDTKEIELLGKVWSKSCAKIIGIGRGMSVLGLYYDIETFPYCEGNKNDREIESMDGFKFSISGCRHEILKLNINNQNINPLSKTEPNLIKKNGDCDLSDEFKDKIYFSDIVAFGSSYIRDLGVNFNPNFMDKKSIGVKYLNVLIKELLENEL